MTADAGTRAEIVDTREGTQCTIYPTGVDDAELVTSWITAGEDAFCALEDAT